MLLTNHLLNRLQKSDTIHITLAGENETAVSMVRPCFTRLDHHDTDARTPDVQASVRIDTPNTQDAHAFLFGCIFRFEERKGSDYAAAEPASVAFDLHLVDARTGDVIWCDTFDATQQALSENLLNINLFINRKGRWVTAAELAAEGLDTMLDTHMFQ